ncbi:aromatic ring-hydroxylating dioxygenase subunit alpha, partial [Rhizobiaceae sp. 2RAB30]
MTAIDPVTRNLWYPVGAISDTKPGVAVETRLLEQKLGFAVDADGSATAWLVADRERSAMLPVRTAYGYVWTSLGEPQSEVFPIPEYAEADRRNVAAASIGVNVSAPRAIENFLDMGHFPYVHT